MKNLEARCIELLKENHCNAIKTDVDAKAVLEELKAIVLSNDLERFIQDDLCVFSNRNQALNWFLEENDDLLELFRALEVNITTDMVGMNLSDVAEISLLEDKENYIKVNDNIHLTYWM